MGGFSISPRHLRTLRRATTPLWRVGLCGLAAAGLCYLPVRVAQASPPRAPYLAAAARQTAVPGSGLGPTDALPRPAWWHGSCDGAAAGSYPGSKPNGASFDGLVSCGPSPHQGGVDHVVQFFPGSWGEYEWECVELSMRFMFEAWGVPPYAANGDGVVANYPEGSPGYPPLKAVANGTVGRPPQPGDVLSIAGNGPYGHTEVVASSSVDGAGDGAVRAISQNLSTKMSGWVSLSVSDWVVSDGVPGDRVLGWLHNPSWSLQLPILWEVTPSGTLEVHSTGRLSGRWTSLSDGIAEAAVTGGAGVNPSPLVAALTTEGDLETGRLLYGTALSVVATGVNSFAISSGSGRLGRPLLAWVTAGGALDLSSGLTGTRPVEPLASGVRRVVLAAGSGPSDALVGVLTAAGAFEVAEGNVAGPLRWQTVATGVSSIALAGGGKGGAGARLAFAKGGRVWEQEGLSSEPLEAAGAGARSLSLAAVGPGGTPLLAWVSAAGEAEVRYGSAAPIGLAAGATAISAGAGPTAMGFPIVAVLVGGRMLATDGVVGRH
ncbi:MAG: CHAP domain-containing protein, partial [Acidimicrobiales bacterium]